ncbi:hypothetical protein IHV12_19715 [Fictibacillus sp. 7GRE50]|uniref:thioester domain-containing protein n=1 Tax=Fictibacillus sp. 7GRE50 TaxID=2745878 RepID=UPI0018CE4416|nr:thioester domain-containing protein [Fictibacillus sp. 7GRE50]MBH0167156.1 hypothetical protein [Fictibacillus sp. 7GRE50]
MENFSREKFLSLLMIATLLFQFFLPLLELSKLIKKVDAASATVVYHGSITYGLSTVGDFTVNGQQAFCIEHSKATPPTGTPNNGGNIYDNKKIAAALYWGWGGDGNIFGSDRNRGIVVTSLVLSEIYTGVEDGGKGIPGYSTLFNKAQSRDVPLAALEFSKASMNSFVEGNIQRTETIRFNADATNKVSFSLPSMLTLHNLTTKRTQSGGTVTLKGGDSFYLTAPLNYDKDFSTGALKGTMKEYSPILYKMTNSSLQVLAKGGWFDPTNTASFTAHFEARQSKINVHHRDAYTKKLIASESYTKDIGFKYSFSPRKDLKKGEYTYRPISNEVQSGTLGPEDITLTFYYDVPLIGAGLEKIQIYTAPAKEKLPVKLKLNRANIYNEELPELKEAKVSVNLYKGNTLIQSNPYTAESLPTSIDMAIPSHYLTVNLKAAYTVKLEGFDPNEIDIPTDARSITTDGYTSSEETITVDAGNQTNLEYTGVVMTEREVGKDMVLFYENLLLSFKKQEKKRTGYGFDAPINAQYSNDLGGVLDTGFNMKISNKLVDSYVSYPIDSGLATVPFDQTESNVSASGIKRTTTKQFELPHVNVERETGYLFSDQQVAAKDSRIKKALRDGGRKFYTPIWGDLGNYPLEFNSTKPIGVNRVNAVIKDNLDIFAFMYGHMDSPTTKQDAILLSPVNPSDPLYPDSWTEQDIEEFKIWNKKVN